MNVFHLNSNHAHIHIGFLYIGWNSNPASSVNGDCGDETFGIGIGNFYVGCYSGTGWCSGFLDKYGCLK